MAAIRHRRCRLLPCLLLVLFAWPAGARAQSAILPEEMASRLNLSQVLDKLVRKNLERADALQKYRGRRYYTLDYKGFPSSFHAEMVVDMTFEAPATKQFKIVSQSGSQFIIDKVLKRLLEAEMESTSEENRARVALNPSNYNFGDLQRVEVPDNCSYVLAVDPKVPSKLLYRGHIWVDSKDFAVCRIEAQPAKNPSFWIKKTEIHHTYLKIGDFWLPGKNESVSSVRGGGRAILTISYQNYEILAASELKESDAVPPAVSISLPDRPN